MSLEQLWAGWRAQYIAGEVGGLYSGECVMCQIAKADDLEANVVHRGKTGFVVMNNFPYASGHVMAVTNRHVGQLDELDDDESPELWSLVNSAVATLKQVQNPQGFNVGINIGAAGGAGFAEHLHIHVVTRWSGDTNFTTTIANTRVLPEALEVTAAKLRSAW